MFIKRFTKQLHQIYDIMLILIMLYFSKIKQNEVLVLQFVTSSKDHCIKMHEQLNSYTKNTVDQCEKAVQRQHIADKQQIRGSSLCN